MAAFRGPGLRESELTTYFRQFAAGLCVAVLAMIGAPAPARADYGHPLPWQMDLQSPASPIMESIRSFDFMLMVIITLVTLFVLALLLVCIFKFNDKANPVPSKTSHNTLIEVLWTVLPVLILVIIAIPSFRLLYAQQVIPKADVVVKATGKQWYWTFEYPDDGKFSFDAIMVQEKDLKPGQPRLLAVDNEVVVPVNKTVVVQVTAADVIHAFALPSFGVKIDAVPGRLNETWFRATREGIYYGQCSELCGKDHAFMPLAFRVVSEADYAKWLEEAKKKYAAAPVRAPTSVAAATDPAIAVSR